MSNLSESTTCNNGQPAPAELTDERRQANRAAAYAANAHDPGFAARVEAFQRFIDGDPIDEAPEDDCPDTYEEYSLLVCPEGDLPRYTCPGDRVVHADRWQDTLDSPSAEDVAWLAANPAPEPEWEPSPEDWRDYHEHCLEQERLDALRRMEDHEYELRIRYGD